MFECHILISILFNICFSDQNFYMAQILQLLHCAGLSESFEVAGSIVKVGGLIIEVDGYLTIFN